MSPTNSIHTPSTTPNKKRNQSAKACITVGKYIGSRFRNHGNHLSNLSGSDDMYKKPVYRHEDKSSKERRA